uniref:Nucleic acid binding OB-fold tRNA/helicase-type protein (RFA1, RPA1, rpa) n=1 Tax=uncultured marine group II/III euryarchaeote AD1000_12_B08 TaxID=1457724 RepID=A0A075FJV6_9EURY|nr:nucleic acid binding OB-fold tRNA/helicase-type protein (RFA1, RPA1, rpa) [uncultured marine group II/III euryarchaeote AD1000_12_B08]
MTADEIDDYVKRVMEQAKDADPEKVREEFEKYLKDFLLPPKDSFRSVLRRFEVSEEKVQSAARTAYRETKKVDRFAELGNEDSNVTIDVKVVTYVSRIQTVRGEEKQIAFGWIEDAPYGESGQSERWDFKDWGEHAENMAPGSVVRMEGVSVNEWKGKKSININRSSRIVVLEEGGPAVSLATSDPITIEEAGKRDGFVTVVGRLMAVNAQTISKKDGSGDLDIIKGKVADSSGAIGFVSWSEFDHEVGTLIRIEGASIRRFRDTPELNIGDRTKVEVFHDSNFADANELEGASRLDISKLTDGSRDVSVVAQVIEWKERNFTNSDGEEKTLWGGEIIDPTGRCRMTAWDKLPIDAEKLPVFVSVSGVRVRSWQGTPDITIDQADQVEILGSPPWDAIDASDHWVKHDLGALVNGGSVNGVETEGCIVSVRSDSGIIHRCPECRRVLRDHACNDHGAVEGVKDMRLRMVIDDGAQSASILLNGVSTEAYLGKDIDQVTSQIDDFGAETFVDGLRADLLGRSVTARGRCLVDEQGAMFLAEELEVSSTAPADQSKAVRAKWGVAV